MRQYDFCCDLLRIAKLKPFGNRKYPETWDRAWKIMLGDFKSTNFVKLVSSWRWNVAISSTTLHSLSLVALCFGRDHRKALTSLSRIFKEFSMESNDLRVGIHFICFVPTLFHSVKLVNLKTILRRIGFHFVIFVFYSFFRQLYVFISNPNYLIVNNQIPQTRKHTKHIII